MTTLVWLRRDLRLADHAALRAAAEAGAVVPVFVWSPEEDAGWPPGAASRWRCTSRSPRWTRSCRRAVRG